jgi:hypothetical protein
MKKINLAVFITLSLLLIGFDLYKASHASFTHDESFSYLRYTGRSFMEIVSYNKSNTNNHILNTLFMKWFEKIFGNSELALRLPNICAHLVFLIFSFKLISRYCSRYIIPYFILLNANPILIDFFSMARGYGISNGLMMAGAYYYCRFLENQKTLNHLFSLLLIGFASLANFALLNVFVVLIPVHFIFQFFIFRNKFSLKNLWLLNRLSFLMTAVFAIILYEPLRKSLNKNSLISDFGGTGNFWNDTVNSLLNDFNYRATYWEITFFFLKMFIIGICLLFLIRSIHYFSGKNKLTLIQKLSLFFGLLVLLIVISIFIQHIFFKTPFLSGRFAIFLFVLFLLMSCCLLEDVNQSVAPIITKSFLYLFSAAFFVHTLFSLNTSWYNQWKYDMNTKEMLTQLKLEQHETNATISLGISWVFEPTINFYRKTLNLYWLNEADRNGFAVDNDFYYSRPEDLKSIPSFNYKIARFYPDGENYLVRNSKKHLL